MNLLMDNAEAFLQIVCYPPVYGTISNVPYKSSFFFFLIPFLMFFVKKAEEKNNNK